MYEKNNDINRRIFFIGGGMLILSSILLTRLWKLQVSDQEKYKLLSDQNRIRITPIFPKRGVFYDRNGIQLALNSSNFKLSFSGGSSFTDTEFITKIGKKLNLDNNQINKLNNKLASARYHKVEIKKNLTIDEISNLNFLNKDIEKFIIEDELKRSYIDSHSFAHLIGYTGSIVDKNSNNEKTTGLSGLELKFDHILSGHLGYLKTEVNSQEKSIRIIDENRAINGQDIVLTIDKNLQNEVYNIMSDKIGAASVMNIQNGEILAMCSTPSFDSNKFINGFSHEEWKKVSHNERNPFLNKALNGEYPPGSTFKIVTTLAGLEEKILKPDEKIFCSGKTKYGKRNFHCWKDKGHKQVDLEKAIKESCDVYFYNLAKKIGIEKISNMAMRLGLGKNYNLVSDKEKNGLIPTKVWIAKNLKNQWRLGDTLVAGIGQGYVATTPIQLNLMISMIANKGFYLEPKLIKSPINNQKNKIKPAGFNFSNLDLIRSLLDKAVNEKGSNAYSSRIDIDDWRMAGKTGTSQVVEITEEERKKEIIVSKNWKERDHALFVGYAPTNKPKYSVSVVIEHGGSGSQIAAPIGRDILLACRKIDPNGSRV